MPFVLSSISFLDIVTPSPIATADDVGTWLASFTVTLVIELALVAMIWPKLGRTVARRRWLWACFIGNVISHPLATLIWTQADRTLQDAAAWGAFIALECAVILFEAFIYRRPAAGAWTNAMTVAVIANTPTALLGAWLCFYA